MKHAIWIMWLWVDIHFLLICYWKLLTFDSLHIKEGCNFLKKLSVILMEKEEIANCCAYGNNISDTVQPYYSLDKNLVWVTFGI